jgi:hypothetical protein
MFGVLSNVSLCRPGSINFTATGTLEVVTSSGCLARQHGLVLAESLVTPRTPGRGGFGQKFGYPARDFSRRRNRYVQRSSPKNGDGSIPADRGDANDGVEGGVARRDDLWNDVFDTGNPSSLVDFRYLEATASEEARNAFLWAAAKNVRSDSTDPWASGPRCLIFSNSGHEFESSAFYELFLCPFGVLRCRSVAYPRSFSR